MIKISERSDRLKKLSEIKKMGVNPYPAKTSRNYPVSQILANFEKIEKNKDIVCSAGRIRSLRQHGNLTFVNLEDGSGKIQFSFSKNEIGEIEYKNFSKYIDVGDFIEIKGSCFMTQAGE